MLGASCRHQRPVLGVGLKCVPSLPLFLSRQRLRVLSRSADLQELFPRTSVAGRTIFRRTPSRFRVATPNSPDSGLCLREPSRVDPKSIATSCQKSTSPSRSVFAWLVNARAALEVAAPQALTETTRNLMCLVWARSGMCVNDSSQEYAILRRIASWGHNVASAALWLRGRWSTHPQLIWGGLRWSPEAI